MDKGTTVENPEDYLSVYKYLLYDKHSSLQKEKGVVFKNGASPNGYPFGRR